MTQGNGGSASKDKDKSQWIFLMKEQCLNSGQNSENITSICKLRHPKTDESSMFLFCHDNSEVYEVSRFSEPFRSWFIDESVQEDGGLYITTRIDATYLVLPYLIQTEKSDKYQIIDQIITDDEFPECARLCACIDHTDLENIADVKGAGDIKAYRYSKDKTLSWLKRKVEQVANKLKDAKVNVSGGALSHVFVRSKRKSLSTTEDFERFAHGLVSDYLPSTLSQELKEFMGITEPEPPVHEKPDIVEPPSKKAKTGKVDPLEDYSQQGVQNEEAKVKKGMTAAQNKLKKVDTKGMKSISSFFAPKSTKKTKK